MLWIRGCASLRWKAPNVSTVHSTKAVEYLLQWCSIDVSQTKLLSAVLDRGMISWPTKNQRDWKVNGDSMYMYIYVRIYIYFDYICITRCGGNSLLSPRGWIVAIPVQLWAGDQQTTREQMLRSWSFQCLGQRSTVRATITMWCPSYKLVYNPMKYMYSIECIDIIYNKF
jgi:hypothetical protein